jgi:resuscitation-promoting factor RpfB
VLRSVKYGLHGAVLAGLVAAPVVWGSVDKSVHLVVDGQARTVHTTADQVGQVLSARGYHVSSHDLVAPSATSTIRNDMHVVLRRGRLLHLEVNGNRTDVWTTAPTVDEALAQLGYATTDFVSVSRSRRLPLHPTDIAIRTPRLITFVHDGTRDQVTTTDETVGELFEDLGIPVNSGDRLVPSSATALRADLTITLRRVDKRTVIRTKTVPYATSKRLDSSMFAGTTHVVRAGKNGKVRVWYSYVYLDGKVIGRTTLKSVMLVKPQTQILKVGTKRVVTQADAPVQVSTAPVPSPTSAKGIARQMLSDRGWGSGQYDCLVTLWNHESGWRVHAANPSGAYGIPQALPGSKMGSAGPDWQNNATTQITWGLGYISDRYGTPCGAWSQWQANGGWY